MFDGAIDVADPNEGLRGWAIDVARPGKKLVLEVLLQNTVVGLVQTGRMTPKTKGVTAVSDKANFIFPWSEIQVETDATIPINASHLDLKVRIQNTDFYINGDVSVNLSGELKKIIKSFKKEGDSLVSHSALNTLRVIAFYLPQYHPIPENDRWWGAGFTDWTNVSQGKPVFPNHYQPHIPGNLGFYDLRLEQTRVSQEKLAEKYSIHGFCYYYYWFAGRKILNGPIESMLASKESNFPFCICWANETWSRRWDGSDEDILIKQEHSHETDEDFIKEILPILKDRRYIKLGSAPILIVYRVSLFPDARRTAETWRNICAQNGIPEIHLCAVESFQITDPAMFGFDSAVEFPPHNNPAPRINAKVADLDPQFRGGVYDYAEYVARDIQVTRPPYTRFKGLMLGWDNSARRKMHSHIFMNSSPQTYEVWLNAAIEQTKANLPSDRQLIFVNAWNEWAEGTHLEPDLKHGSAFLEATARAIQGRSPWEVFSRAIGPSLESDAQKLMFERARSEIQVRDRTIEYLKSLVRDRGGLMTTSRFKAEIPTFLLKKSFSKISGTGSIDRIGPRQCESIGKIHQNEITFLSGWFANPGFTTFETQAFWLSLHAAQSDAIYFAMLIKRTSRADVVQTLEKLPPECSLWSGFECYLDFSSIPSGEYRVGSYLVDVDRVGFTQFDTVLFVE